jgi:hypothetical protein
MPTRSQLLKPKLPQRQRLAPECLLARVSRYLAARDLILVRRRCAIGPAFIIDVSVGVITEKNIPDPVLPTLAERYGLLQPGERAR